MMTTEELYEVLIETDVICTQGQFSQLCGRKFSWASSAISTRREMTLEATLACYCNILAFRDTAASEQDFATYEDLNRICQWLWDEMCNGVESLCLSLAA